MWLHAIFPEIPAEMDRDACWIAFAKTRTPEHHPPIYWLGRALDELARAGLAEAVGARIREAHGPRACAGWSEADQLLQDALTEACATAWVREHLGATERSAPAVDKPGAGVPMLHVPHLDAWVVPRRLWPVRTMEQLLRQTGARFEEAATVLPRTARSRTVYLDIPLNMFGWAQDVGYAMPTTDPLRAAVKHFAGEHHVGYVLTRPFQWGVPLESWY
ncbi:MAG: hypothetical protein U0360_02320 [Dehalococcoidia bacterium]